MRYDCNLANAGFFQSRYFIAIAPDIAGKNIANPYAMIGSVAMMLDFSFNMTDEATNLWQAMESVFAAGYSTPDLSKPGSDVTMVSTGEFGDRVVAALEKLPAPSVIK